MEQNTVFKKELYCMTGFDAKRIFQREMVKTWQNALTNPQWSKTQFSREFYSMTGFDAKPIFQRALVIM